MERNEKCFCGSGKKYKKCHNYINVNSKLANMYRKNNDFDVISNLKGIKNKCPNGCSECCNDLFFVNETEFLMILDELENMGENINSYRDKARESYVIIKNKHPKLIEKLDSQMPKEVGNLIFDYFKDTENLINLPKCIFLNKENKCTIYNVRPGVCRCYGTTQRCNIVENNKIEVLECEAMLLESQLIKKYNSPSIIKRPYPLFYWFSYFLNDPYYEIIKIKLEAIKTLPESKYYDLNLIFSE